MGSDCNSSWSLLIFYFLNVRDQNLGPIVTAARKKWFWKNGHPAVTCCGGHGEWVGVFSLDYVSCLNAFVYYGNTLDKMERIHFHYI